MTGILCALAGSGGIPAVVNFTTTSVARSTFSVPSTAEYQIRNTGFVWIDDTGTLVSYEQWVTPTFAANNYEVFATLSSGALSSGTTGSWLALSSDRSWRCSQIGTGVRAATLAMQVRQIGTTTVLDTWNVDIVAQVF